MNTAREGQNLLLTAIWHGRETWWKSSGFMVNSKCHKHQICIDGLYPTCFLNSKINAKSVDLPKNIMIPATFSTILWRIPTFQNKPTKTEKVRNPTTFDSIRNTSANPWIKPRMYADGVIC